MHIHYIASLALVRLLVCGPGAAADAPAADPLYPGDRETAGQATETQVTEARITETQAVLLIRRGGEQPAEWYSDQARLWSARTAAAPGDAAAWYNLYLATEYAARGGDRKAADRQLDRILERMSGAVPDSYQLPYLQARRLGPDDARARRRFVETALKRCPSCTDVLEDRALLEEIAGNTGTAARYWRALYESGGIASGLLEYNYNALQSVDDVGILFTNGDNDTFPAWILQRAHGVRPDVLVLNLSLARSVPGYLARVLAERQIDIDLSALPDDDASAFVSRLCAALGAARPEVPVFLGLTVAGDYLAAVEPHLQMCGLAYAYAEHPVDNMARLRRNLEHRFRLDYLAHDWYSETHVSTGPVVQRLNTNLCYPALLYSRHLRLAGDPAAADRWRDVALAAAGSNSYLLEQVRNRLEGGE